MISRNVGESRVEIGDFTYGDNELKIRQWGEGASLTIGKYCSIGDGIEIFLGGDHRVDWITTYPFGHTNQAVFNNFAGVGHPQSKGNVVIGNDVWLGSSCKIMSGVSIGDGAVIGGSAVVVKDVAPYSIVGGNPAKLLKYRFDNNTITLLLKLRWWDFSVEVVRSLVPHLCATPDVQLINEILIKGGFKHEVQR